MIMDKLKPCPFCGGEAAFLGETCTIKCKQCGGAFIVTNPGMTRLEVKEAWNRRINDASVRHGHWIKDEFFSDEVNNGEKCSQCGELIGWFGNLPKYCPGCGALMDGGKENG